jgi:hypothetical protein
MSTRGLFAPFLWYIAWLSPVLRGNAIPVMDKEAQRRGVDSLKSILALDVTSLYPSDVVNYPSDPTFFALNYYDRMNKPCNGEMVRTEYQLSNTCLATKGNSSSYYFRCGKLLFCVVFQYNLSSVDSTGYTIETYDGITCDPVFLITSLSFPTDVCLINQYTTLNQYLPLKIVCDANPEDLFKTKQFFTHMYYSDNRCNENRLFSFIAFPNHVCISYTPTSSSQYDFPKIISYSKYSDCTGPSKVVNDFNVTSCTNNDATMNDDNYYYHVYSNYRLVGVPPSSSSSDRVNIGLIVGTVVSSIVCVSIIGVVIYFCMQKRISQKVVVVTDAQLYIPTATAIPTV